MEEKPRSRQHSTYDRMIKAGLKHFQEDLATWLVGERPVAVTSIESGLADTALRFTDPVLLLEFESRAPLFLHVEFQTGGDLEMPERIGEYLTLLGRALKPGKEERPTLACAVIYLDPEVYREDPGVLRIAGDLGTRLHLEYRVIKLWELDPRPFLDMDSPGLCPFVPLMAGNAETLVIESQEKIASAPESLASAESKRELLMVLGTLAGRVIKDRAFLMKLMSEIRIMGENHFVDILIKEGEAVGLAKGREEGLEKGREEGREEGRTEEARHAILAILKKRFEDASLGDDVPKRVAELNDVAVLEALLLEAALCPALDDFRARLEGS